MWIKKATQLLHKLFHIILALLLFISSTGLVINKHYCQNELKSIALFVKAKACHSDSAMKNCPFHNPPDGEKKEKDCCNDETEYVKVDEEQLTPTVEYNLPLNPVLISTLFVVLNFELPAFDKQTLHYLNYKPPLIVCDLPVRLQTFLC